MDSQSSTSKRSGQSTDESSNKRRCSGATLMRKEFPITDAPVNRVVVFRDRAEITRTVEFDAETGDHEVVLVGLPGKILRTSLRVEGRGPAIITDVSWVTNRANKKRPDDYDEKVECFTAALEDAEGRKALVQETVERIRQEKSFWNDCMKSVSKEAFAISNGQPFAVTAAIADNAASFLKVREANMRDVAERLVEQERALKKAEQECKSARLALSEYKTGAIKKGPSNDIVVHLEATATGHLVLQFKYIAFNISWDPKYDIRVDDDKKKMTVHYFANINQNTKEDWKEVSLSLSTAVPAFGGTIPVLRTKQVYFKMRSPKPMHFRRPLIARKSAKGCFRPGSSRPVIQSDDDKDEDSNDDESGLDWGEMEEMEHQLAIAAESGINMHFEVAKPATIPSDEFEHKVTVAILELAPKKIQYKSIPKKSAMAFLEATAVNTSQYPMLPGPASIFFGNSFVATVDFKNTISPQEEFACSLGVDPAVKITYQPVRSLMGQTGMISKANAVTYSQNVEVHNTRAQAISIVVMDQVPLSNDQNLKVVMMEPQVSREKPEAKGYLLNADNNLEHSFDVKERSKYSFAIKYRLEYPLDKEIEEKELAPSA